MDTGADGCDCSQTAHHASPAISAPRTVSSTWARLASSMIIRRVAPRMRSSASPKAWLGESGILRLPTCSAKLVSLDTTPGSEGIRDNPSLETIKEHNGGDQMKSNRGFLLFI